MQRRCRTRRNPFPSLFSLYINHQENFQLENNIVGLHGVSNEIENIWNFFYFTLTIPSSWWNLQMTHNMPSTNFIHTAHGGHLRLMLINQRSNNEKDFYYNEKVIEYVKEFKYMYLVILISRTGPINKLAKKH